MIEFDTSVRESYYSTCDPDACTRTVSVPATATRELEAVGIHPSAWMRIRVDSGEPFFARRGKSPVITLPIWRFGTLEKGKRVHVEIGAGEPYRAVPSSDERFDWLAFLPDNPGWFPTQNGDYLTIWYKRMALTIKRFPPEDVAYWLLGFYQAEGAKRSVLEWCTVSSNPLMLNAVHKTLINTIGIPSDRMSMQILHAPGDDPASARAYFSDIDARIVSINTRTTHKKWKSSGGRGAVLHVEGSIVLYRMTMAALSKLFTEGFPSLVAARAFALGWLEGDGGASSNKRVTRLGLHGTRDEVTLVLTALHSGFDWDIKGGHHVKYTRVRSLTAPETCALLLAGAFAYSMNRARLLYAVENRGRTARDIYSRVGSQPFAGFDDVPHIKLLGLLQPGLLDYEDGLFSLTAPALKLCEDFPLLLPEIETLRRFSPPERLGVTGVKCDPYPKELLVFNQSRIV